MFGVTEDFPDNVVHDTYLGFEKRLEENLGIGNVGSAKALRLFVRTKETITMPEKVPTWVGEVIKKIQALPSESKSVLLRSEEQLFDF